MKGCFSVLFWICLAIIVLFVAAGIFGNGDKIPNGPFSEEQKSAAKSLMAMIPNHAIRKIQFEDRNVIMWTGPTWNALTYEQKQAYGMAAMIEHCPRKVQSVWILDGQTGKRIASCSGVWGFDME